MTIVEAGARFDLGEVDSALRTLENAPIRSHTREDWVVRLRYAYSDLLLKAGRRDDAIEWFHRTAGIDGGGITDAAERILELDGVVLEDTEDSGEAERRRVSPGPQTPEFSRDRADVPAWCPAGR